MNQPADPASTAPVLAGLLAQITGHRPGADVRLITQAYRAAAYWHQGQTRKSGDPYLTHPVAVAAIVADLGADDQMLCAALLHDTAVTLYQPAAAVRRAFGAVLTAAVAASGLVAGGWRAALALAATVLAVLAAVLWILHSHDRTQRLADLIRALRGRR
jgi:hypothetical protein